MSGVHSGFIRTPIAPITRQFDANGTWYKRDKLLFIVVHVQAGGGAGSHAAHSSGTGGAGGFSRKTIHNKDLAAQETVTVGGQASSSSFGAHCSATGGANSNGTAIAAGGTATGGDVNINGSSGTPGTGTIGQTGGGGVSFFAPKGKGGNPYSGGPEGGAGGIVIVEEYYAP